MIYIFFYALVASAIPAFANNIIGNPGDATVIEFTSLTQDLIQRLKNTPHQQLGPYAQIALQIQNSFGQIHIESRHTVSIDNIERDAMNIPAQGKIILNRRRWPQIRLFRDHVWLLALHELLGVLKINDPEPFQKSIGILKRLGVSDLFSFASSHTLTCRTSDLSNSNVQGQDPGIFMMSQLAPEFFKITWRSSGLQKCWQSECPKEKPITEGINCKTSLYDQRVFQCFDESQKIAINSMKSKISQIDFNGVELERSDLQIDISSPTTTELFGPGRQQWNFKSGDCF